MLKCKSFKFICRRDCGNKTELMELMATLMKLTAVGNKVDSSDEDL